VNKTQAALAEWLPTQANWELFATWTFGEKWPNGPSQTSVERHVLRWCSDVPIKNAFVVPERGQSVTRRWHAHGVLGGWKYDERPLRPRALWRDWHGRYGRCSFTPIEQTKIIGCSHYVAKYCLKWTPDFQPRWWITKNGRFHE